MPRAKHTYSVRLAVEGGGKVKAELIQVGEAGDRSFKKIETSSGKASRGLLGLGERTKALGIGIRTLAGALAGVATVGGLSALVDRSISAADAIGKTADKIGVGVEALQELRYAAQLAGIEERTLDMALQRFTRRTVDDALRLKDQLPAPARIRVRPQGRYTEITAYEFNPCSATSAAARPAASAGSMSAGPSRVHDGTGGFGICAHSPVKTSVIGGSA